LRVLFGKGDQLIVFALRFLHIPLNGHVDTAKPGYSLACRIQVGQIFPYGLLAVPNMYMIVEDRCLTPYKVEKGQGENYNGYFRLFLF
jgi:hypothetical protein